MAIQTLFLTGFEHGFIGAAATAGLGLFDVVSGAPTASTSSPRNGSYCCRVVNPGGIVKTEVTKTFGSQTKIVMRVAVKVSVWPGATSTLMRIGSVTGATARIDISAAGVLSAAIGGTSQPGPTIDTTNYHVVELQIDSAVCTLDWKVDGVLQTRVTAASQTAPTSAALGTAGDSQTYTADFDDWIVGTWATAATDWYGDGKILAQLPGSDGGHSAVTSLSFGDAGAALSGTPTTAYTMVDDPPGTGGWTATRSTTDNLALRVADNLANLMTLPVPTAETGKANAVRAIMSYSSSTTTANLAACVVRNSAFSTDELWGFTGGVGQSYAVTANNFKGAIVTRPSAGWTAAEVNAVNVRFGGPNSADVSPVPTLQAWMLEVDWPVAPPPTATPVGRVSLGAASTPASRTVHALVARARKTSGTGTVTLSMALYEGSTNRSGDLTSAPLTTSLADVRLAIPDAAAAAITDYSDLEVRFWANSPTGDTVTVEIAGLYLETPPSSGPQAFPRTALDTVALSDAVLGDAALVPRTAVDTVATSDVAVRAAAGTRPVADTVTLSDVAVRAPSTRTRPVVDTVALSDVATRVATKARVAVDTVVLSDAASRVLTTARTASDSWTITDGGVSGAIPDPVSLGTVNDATNIAALTLTTTAAVAVGDTIFVAFGIRSVARTLSSIVDSAGNTYAIEATKLLTGGPSDYSALARCVATNALPSGGTITANIGGGATTSDKQLAAAKVAGVALTPDGSPGIAESAGVAGTAYSSPSITTTAANRLLWGEAYANVSVTSLPGSGITELQEIGGAASKLVTGFCQLATPGAYSFSGTWSNNANWTVITVAYAAPAAPGIARVAAFVRPAADTVALSDAVGRVVSEPHPVSDTVALSDVATGVFGAGTVSLPRTASDSWSVADVVTRGASIFTRTAPDSVAISDTAVRAPSTQVRSTVDSVALSDAATRAVQAQARTVSDTVTFADTVVRAPAARVRTASDVVAPISDVVTFLAAPAVLPFQAGTAVAQGSVGLRAPPQLPLANSSALASGALALVGVPRLSLSGAASASASLALAGPAIIPLAASSVVATGTLNLLSPAIVTPAASSAVATGTLALFVPGVAFISISGSALATGTLALTAPAKISLDAGAAVAAGTLALTAPARLSLSASTIATGTLALVGPGALVLAASAQATGTLALVGPALMAASGTVVATGTLTLKAPAFLSLGASSVVATGTAALTIPQPLALISSATSSGSLLLIGLPKLVLAGSATATGSLSLLLRANLILSGSAQATGTFDLFVPTLVPGTLPLAPSTAQASGTLLPQVAVHLGLSATAQASGSLVVISLSVLGKHERLYLEVIERGLSLTTMITEGRLHLLVNDPGVPPMMIASVDERSFTVAVSGMPMKIQVLEDLDLRANIDIPISNRVEVEE